MCNSGGQNAVPRDNHLTVACASSPPPPPSTGKGCRASVGKGGLTPRPLDRARNAQMRHAPLRASTGVSLHRRRVVTTTIVHHTAPRSALTPLADPGFFFLGPLGLHQQLSPNLPQRRNPTGQIVTSIIDASRQVYHLAHWPSGRERHRVRQESVALVEPEVVGVTVTR